MPNYLEKKLSGNSLKLIGITPATIASAENLLKVLSSIPDEMGKYSFGIHSINIELICHNMSDALLKPRQKGKTLDKQQ